MGNVLMGRRSPLQRQLDRARALPAPKAMHASDQAQQQCPERKFVAPFERRCILDRGHKVRHVSRGGITW
jgi:hypothetical protein